MNRRGRGRALGDRMNPSFARAHRHLGLRALLSALVAGVLACTALGASARTLAEVKARGTFTLCANPDSLPYASQSAKPLPGFQVEIGQALARGLGVDFDVGWLGPAWKARLVNCDFFLDAFDDPAIHEGKLLLSKPYHKTGVALLIPSGHPEVKRFDDVPKGSKVGVMVGSLAQTRLGQRGLTTSPYSFESDMLQDVASGALFGAACSPANGAWFLLQHPDAKLELVHAYDSESELSWRVAVGMRKADADLVEAVNGALQKLMDDGTLEKIYAHYGVPYRRP